MDIQNINNSTMVSNEDSSLTVSIEDENLHESSASSQLTEPFSADCLEKKRSPDENRRKEKGYDGKLLLKLASNIFKKLSQKKKIQWNPTSIQLQTWPIMANAASPMNLIAIASTGSGKTLAYTIPIVYSCLLQISSMEENSLDSISTSPSQVHGLALLPTRELVIQVSKVVKTVGKVANKLSIKKNGHSHLNIVSLAIYGGVDKSEQIDSILQRKKNSAQFTYFIVAATPMRLIDILGIGQAKNESSDLNTPLKSSLHELFKATKFIVLDEADRLATQTDLSQQIDTIVDFVRCTSSCLEKTCLFSATLPERAKSKCNTWVKEPRLIVKVNSVTVGSRASKEDASDNSKIITGAKPCHEEKEEANDVLKVKDEKSSHRHGILDLSSIPPHITQTLHVCANHKKPKKLMITIKKIRDGEKKQDNRRRKGLIIIFFARIKTLQYIHGLIEKEGVTGVAFHSQMNQEKREAQLNLFRCGKCPILFATDIAARGLHCNNVEYIINYDFPGSLEQYVHRCGRAGRNKISNGVGDQQSNSTVYSFFHRELAPMAADTIELLRSCNAWVDPNLLSLVRGGDTNATDEPKRKRRRKNIKEDPTEKCVPDKKKTTDSTNEAMAEPEDEFSFLNQNRITLKRASHVSLDSDDD